MTFFDSVKGTVSSAVDVISSATQSFVEKNRTNAKLNRLRTIMKNESELMNRAYIALGKHYYEGKTNGNEIKPAEEQKLFEVIETSKSKIAKARSYYRKIVDSQNDVFYGSPEQPEYDSSSIVDITVACSNENEYESSPFDIIEDVNDADTPEDKAENNDTAPVEETPDEKNVSESDGESPEDELF